MSGLDKDQGYLLRQVTITRWHGGKASIVTGGFDPLNDAERSWVASEVFSALPPLAVPEVSMDAVEIGATQITSCFQNHFTAANVLSFWQVAP